MRHLLPLLSVNEAINGLLHSFLVKNVLVIGHTAVNSVSSTRNTHFYGITVKENAIMRQVILYISATWR